MFLASWKYYFRDDSTAGDHNTILISSLSWLTLLKKRVQSHVMGARPHHAPSFFLTYLFSKVLCAPNSHLSRYFWPQSALLYFGVPLVISFALDSDQMPHLGIFRDLLWKEQYSHTQSDEGSFCCKCQNSKMFSLCGYVVSVG